MKVEWRCGQTPPEWWERTEASDLGGQAGGTPVEVGHLPHVAQPGQEHKQTREPESETTVRRHSVAEEVEVEPDLVRLDALLDGLSREDLDAMFALGACGDLGTSPEQVEALGVTGLVAHVVEGPDVGRPVFHEDEFVAVGLLGPFAEQTLAAGVQVAVPVGNVTLDLLEDVECLLHGDAGEGEGGYNDLDAEALEDRLAVLVLDLLEDVGEPLLFDAHDVVVGFHPRDLHVHRGELSVVADRVGVVGSKDRTDFEDPPPAGRHGHLLVELGRLGEVGLLSEVRDTEEFSAGLGGVPHKLWRVHLQEPIVHPPLTHGVLEGGLDCEDQSHGRTAEVQEAPVKALVQGSLSVDGKRRRGEPCDLDSRRNDLLATEFDLFVELEGAGHDDRRLPRDREELLREGGVAGFVQRDLGEPSFVPEYQEQHVLGVSGTVHPPFEGHFLTLGGEISNESAHCWSALACGHLGVISRLWLTA